MSINIYEGADGQPIGSSPFNWANNCEEKKRREEHNIGNKIHVMNVKEECPQGHDPPN